MDGSLEEVEPAFGYLPLSGQVVILRGAGYPFLVAGDLVGHRGEEPPAVGTVAFEESDPGAGFFQVDGVLCEILIGRIGDLTAPLGQAAGKEPYHLGCQMGGLVPYIQAGIDFGDDEHGDVIAQTGKKGQLADLMAGKTVG